MTDQRPLVIAHRGATAYAPENSYEAVAKAVELGLDAIEVDLRPTGDGKFVFSHDDNIERMTGLKRKISHLTEKEIRKITLFYKGLQDNRFPQGRFIFLDELLELTDRKILVNIELKGPHWSPDVLETQLLGPIQKRGMERQILISSFFHLPLLRLQRMTASVKTGLLLHPAHYRLYKSGLPSKRLETHSIHPPYQLASPERIRNWHQEGYAIYVWTVNDHSLYEELIRAGVNGIITDIPEELLGRKL